MTPATLTDLIERYAPQVNEMRDPMVARGRCYEVSREFAEYLTGHGLDAEWWGVWADDVGFAERVPAPWLQDDSHVVCLVRVDGRIFTVDWTASQYGRDEFPLVREIDEPPKRDPWLLSPAEAEELMRQMRAAVAEMR